MKSRREIQTEVKQYWESQINEINRLVEENFAQFIKDKVATDADIPKYVVLPRGVTMEFEGHHVLYMPDFKEIKSKLELKKLKSLWESLEGVPAQSRFRIYIDVFGERPMQYEKFFCEGGYYNYLWLIRNEIDKQRKWVRIKLPSLKAIIYNILRKSLMPIPKMALQNAYENIAYSLTFFDLLISHADKWFKRYGVEANTEKDYRKHKCWENIIQKGVSSIENERVKHTHACRMTAALLAAVYPKIWGKNSISENTEIIRQRIYRAKYP